jgi:hypothetical protein
MDLQKPIEYPQMFKELLIRRAQLVKQRDETEVELVKVAQLIGAVYPLLSEKEQESYKGTMEQIENESGGLQDAIKLVFSTHPNEWLSASKVRDFLTEMGFDFRHYQANPLSAISTTLRRMTPTHLKSDSTADGILYCRVPIEHPAMRLKERARKTVPPPPGLDDIKK